MTYEYKCSIDSEHKYVEVRSINAEVSRTTCAAKGCGGKLIRVFSAPPITFKGSGFSSTKG
jgi:predicted nucleic acid-binding Zn ribbon protein